MPSKHSEARYQRHGTFLLSQIPDSGIRLVSTVWYHLLEMAIRHATPRVGEAPILDSGIRPKRARTKVVNILLGFLIGLLFSIVLIRTEEYNAENPASDCMPLFFFAAFLLAVIVHEAGHLIAGWIVRFRFKMISIGPFCLKIEYGRLKIQARAARAGLAGYASMNVGSVRRLRRRLLIFISGGPAANLLSAGATFGFLDYLFPSLWHGWVSIFFNLFVGISLLLGLLNLVPFSTGGFFSDGSRIKMLLRSPVGARRWMSITALINQSQKGVRSKHLRRTWLRAASSAQDGSIDDFSGNWLAYAWANARKDESISAFHLERCLHDEPSGSLNAGSGHIGSGCLHRLVQKRSSNSAEMAWAGKET